ncbi:efflux RND transporter periplasmic adaptor subunit [Pinisolibacter aquiterrae]|uniref:efflux RND transporter periplasmic adaptor subunit n=1 Tax=Pinisolibacter aquiterrae TaxID=2815579 RepID=UPI001C3D73B6|nr:efflux RND transporter periplasmic adaptor subunit [Pinisolibacter aquiterrae]MCC8234230.1 efflux RND transporter periplasmic adaptor subunit [Pinisolibacter aquiterrae]
MNRAVKLALLAATVAALGFGAFRFSASRPVSVTVAAPIADVAVQVFGLGTQEARIASRLGFETAAALVELNADHGDRVAKGTLLARLQDGEQRARVAKSAAGVSAAETALAKAEALAERATVIARQKAQINERRQSLVERRTVSVEAAEQAEMDARVATADQAIAARDVEVARVGLDTARAQLVLDEVLLERHRLVAPFDGVVIARTRELGAVMNPGEALFTLVDPATVWIQAFVDEARAGDLAVGQPAEVRLRSRPGEVFAGAVARVGLENDRVGEERRLYVDCRDCPADFHLGEQAEVIVTTRRLAEALVVAEKAVQMTAPAEGVVWTVEGGRLEERTVRLGARLLDGRVAIVGGLPEGARVVAALPASGLMAGRAARIVEPAAEAAR